jgi:cell division transport system permease protein
VLAAGAGLALNNVAANARAEIAGGLTVQIVEGAPAERDRQAERTVAFFSNRSDVAAVRRVPEAELAALLEPWLGEAVNEEDAVRLRLVQERPTTSGPLIIIYSNDLDATERAVTAAGATIVARQEFPGGKRFHFVDPGGCELAVWTKVSE